MRLSKYIRDKLHETWPSKGIPTEKDIEMWLLEYNENKNRNKLPLEYKDEIK
jgi:hypothetical protein